MATSRRSGPGRGLGALIPGADEVTGGVAADASDSNPLVGSLREVPIAQVRANTFQPRKSFDESALQGLAESIKELGILQPLLVRLDGADNYELIAGERRLRAAKLAGLREVPVIVRPADNMASLSQALVENLHRRDLNALDEAAAYQQLIDDFEMTHDQVAKRVGKARTTISNQLRLMTLPARVQKLLIDGKITEGHARALLGTNDNAFRTQLAERIAKEGLSVRATEEAIRLRTELAEPEKKRRAPSKGEHPAALEWQERLSEHLSTRVAVTTNGKRGKVVIEFADLEDLERIGSAVTVISLTDPAEVSR